MNKWIWGVMVVAACGPIDLGPCFLANSAFDAAVNAAFHEANAAPGRPDFVTSYSPDGGGGTYFSGAMDGGGRIAFIYQGPVQTGAVPQEFGDSGCGPLGNYAVILPGDGGAIAALNATVTVSDGGNGLTQIVASGITADTADGGTAYTLPDRSFTLALP